MSRQAALVVVLLAGALGLVVVVAVVRRPSPQSSTPRPKTESPSGREPGAPTAEGKKPDVSGESEPSVGLEVVDGSGRPVAEASVIDVKNYSKPLAVTDGDGRCSIPHAALQFERVIDVATIRVEHPKYAPQMVRFARHTTQLRVVMTDMGTLVIRVVDAQEVPIPRATIEHDEPERSMLGSPWAPERRTDDNGALTISGLRPGPFIVRAWAAGFAEGRAMAFAPAKEAATVKVVLQKGRTLDVRVVTGDGKGVPGSKVTLTNYDGVTGWSPETGVIRGYWIRATGADGVATFESLPTVLSEIHLSVEGPTHPPKHEEILLKESVRQVELTVDPGATLVVDVLDAKGSSVACLLSLYATHDFESQELSVEKGEGAPDRPPDSPGS